MSTTKFAGGEAKHQSLLGPIERRFVNKFVSRIPAWLETYHLTLLTLPWCAVIIYCSYLAGNGSIHWLWLVSLAIFFQYLTDLFDGAVGRHRNTGLIKWGYYMDHFLDYIFLCSILIGYTFIIESYSWGIMFFVLAVFGAFMVNSYLSFAASNKFKIAYLGVGPTEIRIIFIIINALIIFDKTMMTPVLPYVLAFAIFGLVVVVYQTSRYLWNIDMENKKNEKYES